MDTHLLPFEREAADRGRAEGRAEEARRAILHFVEARFGSSTAEIASSLEKVVDLLRLEALIRAVAVAENLEAVEQRVTDAVAGTSET